MEKLVLSLKATNLSYCNWIMQNLQVQTLHIINTMVLRNHPGSRGFIQLCVDLWQGSKRLEWGCCHTLHEKGINRAQTTIGLSVSPKVGCKPMEGLFWVIWTVRTCTHRNTGFNRNIMPYQPDGNPEAGKSMNHCYLDISNACDYMSHRFIMCQA